MTSYLRKNAWDANNGGQFKDASGNYTFLYWYAKGVAVMKSKPISDPTSWWFYAAIHGQYLTDYFGSGPAPTEYPNWTKINSIPASANLNSLPSQNLINLFWNQCQHGTWFFTPWHRGYLVALENILRDIIVGLGGPSDWAFPYWDYMNQSTTYQENHIPPAFTLPQLPDGTPNALYVPERYGPVGNPANVYLIVGPGLTNAINDECQWDTLFSSSSDPQENPNPSPDQPGNTIFGDHYGGAQTGFSHSNGGFGDLEMNPHNFVHSMVGGLQSEFWSLSGFMFNVQSKLPWQSTGINIEKGSTVSISYASGEWTADPSDNAGQLYDANGSPDIIVPASQPLYPIVNKPMGGLIGRVNGGAPFFIGDGVITPFVVPNSVSGLLELCINDDLTGAYGAGLTDNEGQITVNISPVFKVQSTQPWQNTGISIAPGSTVVISATGGAWTADPSDDGGTLYGANGSPDIIVPASQPLYPIVNVPMGALIGRVNGGTPFLIASGSVVPDNVSGPLELCINDDLTGAYGAGLKDNEGAITVSFTTTPAEEYEGLMADPGLAGLDPVFFMHHANIDRMWAAWIETGKNQNTTNPNWLAGPSANGNSQFAMPLDATGKPWYYIPADVVDTNNLKYYNGAVYSYTYDNLSLTSYSNTPPAKQGMSQRLTKLGVTNLEKGINMSANNNSELVGASGNSIVLKTGATQTAVKLDATAWKTLSASIKNASVTAPPDEVYLQLENVTGTNNSNTLSVYVNNKLIKTVSLFGIRMASMQDSAHGGSGLTFKFNISNIVDDMHLANNLDVASLNVQIKTNNPIPKGSVITVGRISVYRAGQ
ncbi:MAG: tyrosinase family protein [Bacteroidia bacterium]